ncbi:replication initiator protein A [Cerasicoccus arenae]|uniref:Replication initiator protein A n=1 Tax=Cerasicoccus arenae TaxID=424488 RepID=A0A8J3DIJ8_9BACT|nr:replication initiator protein A [Cerasicoccus arenae]MBK1857762.1 replication initiator protein A [Cerasicoccus arenae]GHC11908.1 hypothetical protein GCM10007047_31570 [Cerasicoccus arenae]
MLRPIKRNRQLDLFIPLPGAVAPKAQQELMMRSWMSLAKQGRSTPIEHHYDNQWVRITGDSENGIATIWDHDLLIYFVSQWREAQNRGLETSNYVHFTPYDYWTWLGLNRGGGRDYHLLKDQMRRLHTTHIETNFAWTEEGEGTRKQIHKHTHQFNWVQEWRYHEINGVVRGIEAQLPEWFYRAALDEKSVLTISEEYFRLTSGLERWLYLYCRKAAGRQRHGWQIRFRLLYEYSQLKSPYKRFAQILRKIIAQPRQIPEYTLREITNPRGESVLQILRIDQELNAPLLGTNSGLMATSSPAFLDDDIRV